MKRLFLLLAIGSLFVVSAVAQNKDAAQMAKQANNPLASITTISIQNVYTPSFYAAEGSFNTGWIRCVQPIGRVLIRASLAINTANFGDGARSGLGDLNIFATYILSKPTAHNQFGIGPIITCPTATDKLLGGGKWQAGIAVAGYFAKSDILQMGFLATWQHSFAGDSDRNKIQVASLQPFFMWQVGKGTYLRSTAINMLDFENGTYVFPLGVGLGKISKVNKMLFNIFAEPQFTLWYKGRSVPKVQIFVGVNIQF